MWPNFSGFPRLEDTGFEVGLRLLEFLCFREKGSKRDVRVLDILKFIHSSLWKYLFGRQARDLEQSNTVIHILSLAIGTEAANICSIQLDVYITNVGGYSAYPFCNGRLFGNTG